MQYIEKFLFIHESQIKRWGKVYGLINILSGLLIICGSFYLYYWVLEQLAFLKVSLISLGEQYDPLLGEKLGRLVTHSEGAFLGGLILCVALGISSSIIGILILKLYKSLNNA